LGTVGANAAKAQEFISFSLHNKGIPAKVQVFLVAIGRLAAFTPKLLQKCRNSASWLNQLKKKLQICRLLLLIELILDGSGP
jgi:hypothetical protein